MTTKNVLGRGAAAWALALFAMCGTAGIAGAETAASGTVLVRGAGATFPAPLYVRWIDDFKKTRTGIDVTYDSVGSGEGVNRFVTGSVDFGATDGAVKDSAIRQVGRGVVIVPATAGMVVLAYNLPGVTGTLKLPRDVYPDIFLGTITRWNDPRIQNANPDLKLPNRTIVTVARSDSSGTTYAFSNHLSTINEPWRQQRGAATLISWPAAAMLVRGNEGVSARIKISEGAIGYVEYGFAKRLKLPVAALQNRAGRFVMPDAESGRVALAAAPPATSERPQVFVPDPDGASSYPIVSFSWMLLYGEYADQRKRDAVKDFVGSSLVRGQAVAGEMGYIPLPQEVVAQGVAAVQSIR